MPPAGFEPVIPRRERPQPHILGRATNGIGYNKLLAIKYVLQKLWANSCTLCILHEHKKGKMSRTCKKWLRYLIPKPESIYTLVMILNRILQIDWTSALLQESYFTR